MKKKIRFRKIKYKVIDTMTGRDFARLSNKKDALKIIKIYGGKLRKVI